MYRAMMLHLKTNTVLKGGLIHKLISYYLLIWQYTMTNNLTVQFFKPVPVFIKLMLRSIPSIKSLQQHLSP